MPYAIHEIEVSENWSLPTLGSGDDGLAVILRRYHRPVGFWMWSRSEAKHSLSSRPAFEEAISIHASRMLVLDAIRDELKQQHSDLASRRTSSMASEPPKILPSLTIAICTRNRPDKLKRLLDSVCNVVSQQGPMAAYLEILVVDNCPPDEATKQLVEQKRDRVSGFDFPTFENGDQLRYVREASPGLDFARNRAMDEARGDWIAFLDDDVVLDRGWLSALQHVWRSQPDAMAVTGLVLPKTLSTPAQILFERRGGFRRGFETIRYQGPTHPGNPLFPCGAGIFGAGANMAFNLSLLRGLGGFDEALDTGPPLPGGGDLDVLYRVVRSGNALVYEPAVTVYHEHREDLPGLRRQFFTWSQGMMAFMEKSWNEDPPMRRKLFALYLWWWGDMFRRIAQAAIGRNPLPLSMLLMEAWGGIIGMAWQYRRSQNHVAAIKQVAEHRKNKRDLKNANFIRPDAS